jgi:hypothetical protein
VSFDEQLERAQADGRMSPEDADEVRHFADFLGALGAAGVPPMNAGRTPEQRRAFSRIYAEHYPGDYARAVAEEKARRAQQDARHRYDDQQMGYGQPTTSPASPGGPEPEEDPTP